MTARKCAQIAGAVIALAVIVLTIDWAMATYRKPIDDKLIKALQEKVKSDAALAPKLAAEQKRVTGTRLSRRIRDQYLGWLLIATGLVFLHAAKRTVASRKVPQPEKAAGRACCNGAGQRKAAGAAEALDLSFVDGAVARLGRGQESAIPLLQAIQQHYRYLPDEAMAHLCAITDITPAMIAGTSTFYGQFRTSPVGKHIVKVCHGTACHVAGARQVSDELRRYLALPDGANTDADRMFTIEEVACVGCCSLAPVMMVDDQTAGRLTPASAAATLAAVEQKETA